MAYREPAHWIAMRLAGVRVKQTRSGVYHVVDVVSGKVLAWSQDRKLVKKEAASIAMNLVRDDPALFADYLKQCSSR